MLTHLVSLHLGKPAMIVGYVAGQRRRTEMVTPESLFVFPARVRFAGEWQSRLTRQDLLIDPEFCRKWFDQRWRPTVWSCDTLIRPPIPSSRRSCAHCDIRAGQNWRWRADARALETETQGEPR